MSTSAATPASQRNTLIWSIVVGGLIIAVLRLVDNFFIYSFLLKYPIIVLVQYIASGILGNAAFAGGLGTAALGMLIHLVNALVISAIFMLAAQRLPVLRRNLIPSGLVYGVVVWFVMNLVVIPLSAAPPPEIVTVAIIVEGIIGMAVLVGLPLALIARRNVIGSM